MRIAVVSFDGGEYSVQLCSALAQLGSTIKLFIPKETVSPHADALDASIELFIYQRPRMREVWKSLRFLVETWRGIRDFQPDVVHIQHHHFWFYAMLLPLISRRYHTVITVHDPVHHSGDRESQKTPQGLVHRGYHRADDLIVHAAALKTQMVASLGFNADSIHVIPHIAVSNSNRASSHIAEDDATVLFFGRIWEYKGLEYLIKAEPLITEKVPHVKIIIAGKGEELDRYSAMMAHPDRFLVHNDMIPWDDAARYFSQASVVVLPYTDASSSGVIPVAYSFAKPVVVSDVGGLSEMVEDGMTGILVPPRDERAIADAVVRLVKDPALRHRMGTRGKEKLAQECGGDVVARKTMMVYERRVR